MAQVSLTIPDAILPRVIEGVCTAEGYTGQDPSGNPETKPQFVRRMLIQFLKDRVSRAEAQAAATAAAAAAQAEIDTDIVIS